MKRIIALLMFVSTYSMYAGGGKEKAAVAMHEASSASAAANAHIPAAAQAAVAASASVSLFQRGSERSFAQTMANQDVETYSCAAYNARSESGYFNGCIVHREANGNYRVVRKPTCNQKLSHFLTRLKDCFLH